MNGARQHAGIAVERAYRFVLWVVPTVERFPRSQKFFLGDRIHGLALDVLEGLLEATYTKDRLPILTRVNLLLEKLRVLFRLAKDLRQLDLRRYEHAAEELNEVGRLVGGWLKTHRAA
ncbi:MAG: diversity-generating retroelement protein Avd [Pseudomonadota bacterium]|nr:diversity-generating retroelement protein Avd [Pseudomonadota bacterium]